MNNKAALGAQLAKPPLLLAFIIQCVVLVLGSLGLLLVGPVTAYSVFFGGLIFIVPNSYFARWAFRYSGARAANEIARSFYRGEAGKFLLTVLFFAGVFFLVTPLEVAALFFAYLVMMMLNGFLASRLSR